MKHFRTLVCTAAIAIGAALPVSLGACNEGCAATPAEVKAVESFATTISTSTCAALGAQSEPEWVTVACAIEGGAITLLPLLPLLSSFDAGRDAGALAQSLPPGYVKIRIPRLTWETLKATDVAKDGGKK
jgi:hypothetical protein